MTRSTVSLKDRHILRRLGAELAEAAADPVNEERREIHRRVDRMEPGRPSITIIQEPWNELNVGGELDPRCEDDFLRGIEREIRMTLYKWRHHPGDMVVEAAVGVARCVQDTGFGIAEDVDIVRTDADSDVVSRHFHIQVRDEADIAKIKTPRVSHDAAATQERYEKAASAFDGVLKVNLYTPAPFGWFAPWDEIVRLTGVEEVLTDMIDRPEYVHKLVSHFVDCWLARLDQYESQGLLDTPASEMTVSGAAQIFSEVSPAMHDEFALQHEARYYRRFKRVHYGCCEPLHHKVEICARRLPNMYQISMSPWVDFAVGARNVGRRFIFGWRPNPAFLAMERWDPDLVRRDLADKLAIAREHGCTVAIYMKDISTVRHEPRRLTEWDRIARECVSQ